MSFSLMLADARRFTKNFFDADSMTDRERETWTKEFVLQSIAELTEVLGEINWKHHKLTRKPIDRSKLLEELIDVLKFWTNIMVVWQFTPVEIIGCWAKKTTTVEQKFAEQRASGMVYTSDQDNLRNRLLIVEEERQIIGDELMELRQEYVTLERNYEQLRKEYDNVR